MSVALLVLFVVELCVGQQYAVHIDTKATSIEEVCQKKFCSPIRRVGELDVWVVEHNAQQKRTLGKRLDQVDGVIFADELRKRRYAKRAVVEEPKDPLYPNQWHLSTINAQAAWQKTRGEGVVIQIIDDGAQFIHGDLRDQYVPSLSQNFNLESGSRVAGDPSPDVSVDFHGTSCCGVAAAKDNNVCGVGAAYRANIAAIRLISDPVDDATEAEGLTFGLDGVGVRSCSWGPTDDGKRLEGPQRVAEMAMQDFAVRARGGLGSVWIWAGGNGGREQDDCNYDGYANHPLTLAVGAISDAGRQSSYSEPCAALVVSAPSSGGSRGITTTDLLGSNGYSSTDCTDSFGGTSSAAPLVAGVVGLVLSANPKLSWKDVQYIMMNTAIKVDPNDTDWVRNGAGRWVSHRYGYGMVDANASVTMALNYGPSPRFPSKVRRLDSGLMSPMKLLSISGDYTTVKTFVNQSDLSVEHVQVELTMRHPDVTHLDIWLTSPAGTRSRLSSLRKFTRQPSIRVIRNNTFTPLNSAVIADFSPVSSKEVIGLAAKAPASDPYGCSTLDPALVSGRVWVVQRGECFFQQKARLAQQAGAVGVVVVALQGQQPVVMGGDGGTDITIPTVMVSWDDGQVAQVDGVSIRLAEIVQKEVVSLQMNAWKFSSVRHWDEMAYGEWSLDVRDGYPSNIGTWGTVNSPAIASWRLIVWHSKDLGDDSTTSTTTTSSTPVEQVLPLWAKALVAGVGGAVLVGGLVFLGITLWRKRRENQDGNAHGQLQASPLPTNDDLFEIDLEEDDGDLL